MFYYIIEELPVAAKMLAPSCLQKLLIFFFHIIQCWYLHNYMYNWLCLQITLQIEQATRPGISQVQVEWGPLRDKQDPPLQAPCRIPSLFSASRQVVYGLALKNCTQVPMIKTLSNLDWTIDIHVTTAFNLNRQDMHVQEIFGKRGWSFVNWLICC